MSDFERIKIYYDNKWCNIFQLRQFVEFNKITIEQFKSICGEDY